MDIGKLRLVRVNNEKRGTVPASFPRRQFERGNLSEKTFVSAFRSLLSKFYILNAVFKLPLTNFEPSEMPGRSLRLNWILIYCKKSGVKLPVMFVYILLRCM